MSDSHITIENGFAPIIGNAPKILILGTMPSVQSLKSQQYYGHPRNAFWWIMSELCGFDPSLGYSEKVDLISRRKIAVWDVIASCYRPGSLDSKIDQGTVTPNPIDALLQAEPTIGLLCFNGQAAEKLFNKFIKLPNWQGENVILPSTSPANAAMTREAKRGKWSIINEYLSI